MSILDDALDAKRNFAENCDPTPGKRLARLTDPRKEGAFGNP